MKIIKPSSQKNLENTLNGMKKYKKLKLTIESKNPLKIVVPPFVVELDLSRCNVSSLRITSSNILTYLTLPSRETSGPSTYDLTNGNKIKRLNANDSYLTRIPTLVSLEVLDACHSDVEIIEYQPKIQIMSLDYSKVKDLPKSTTITSLSIVDLPITTLPNYPTLEYLYAFNVKLRYIPESISKTLKVFVGSYHVTFACKPTNLCEYFIHINHEEGFHAIRNGWIKNVKPNYDCNITPII